MPDDVKIILPEGAVDLKENNKGIIIPTGAVDLKKNPSSINTSTKDGTTSAESDGEIRSTYQWSKPIQQATTLATPKTSVGITEPFIKNEVKEQPAKAKPLPDMEYVGQEKPLDTPIRIKEGYKKPVEVNPEYEAQAKKDLKTYLDSYPYDTPKTPVDFKSAKDIEKAQRDWEEKSYIRQLIEGGATGANISTGNAIKDIGYAEELFSNSMNYITGGIYPKSDKYLIKLGDEITKKGNEGLSKPPDDLFGDITYSLGSMNMLPLQLEMMPVAKIGYLSKITGGVVQDIPKLAIYLGSEGALKTYSETGSAVKAAESLGEGVVSGITMHYLASLGSIAGSVVKNPLASQVVNSGVVGSGFAGLTLTEGGNAREAITSGAVGVALSIPEIGKAAGITMAEKNLTPEQVGKTLSTYFSSTPETIKSVADTPIDKEKFSKEYTDLSKKYEETTDVKEKEKIGMALDAMNNFSALKLSIDNVSKEPQKYVDIVNNSDNLKTPEEKAYFIDLIQKTVDATLPNGAKEIQEKINIQKSELKTIEDNTLIGDEIKEVKAKEIQSKIDENKKQLSDLLTKKEGVQDAVKEGEIGQGGKPEYQGTEKVRQTTEPSSSDSAKAGGKVEEEVTITPEVTEKPPVVIPVEETIKTEANEPKTTTEATAEADKTTVPAKATEVQMPEEEIEFSEQAVKKERHRIAEESVNPDEIYNEYVAEAQDALYNKMDFWQQEVLGAKIKPKSFYNFKDRNYVKDTLAKEWFNKNGESLDTLADDISERTGQTVTPEMIANFMVDKSNGKYSERTTTDLQNELAARYEKVTGISIKKHIEKEIISSDTLNDYLKEKGVSVSDFKDLNEIRDYVEKNKKEDFSKNSFPFSDTDYSKIKKYLDSKTSGKEVKEKTVKERRRGVDLIASGFDDIAELMGVKKNILGEERPKLINAIKKITQGIYIETGKFGIDLIKAVTDRLKTNGLLQKLGLKENDIYDMADEIMPTPKDILELDSKAPQGLKTKRIIEKKTGVKKDDKKILLTEYSLLKKRIKDAERGRKEGYKIGKDEVREKVKELQLYKDEISKVLNSQSDNIKKLTGAKITTLVNKVNDVKTLKQLGKALSWIEKVTTDAEYNSKVKVAKANQDKINVKDFQSNKSIKSDIERLKNIDFSDKDFKIFDNKLLDDFNTLAESLVKKGVKDVSGISKFMNEYDKLIEESIDKEYLSKELKSDDIQGIIDYANEVSIKIDEIKKGNPTINDVVNLKREASALARKINNLIKNGDVQYDENSKTVKSLSSKLNEITNFVNNKGLEKISDDVKQAESKYKKDTFNNSVSDVLNIKENKLNVGNKHQEAITEFKQAIQRLKTNSNLLDRLSLSDIDNISQITEQLKYESVSPKLYSLTEKINKVDFIDKVNTRIFDRLDKLSEKEKWAKELLNKNLNELKDKLLTLPKNHWDILLGLKEKGEGKAIEEELTGEITNKAVEKIRKMKEAMFPVVKSVKDLGKGTSVIKSLRKIGIALSQLDYISNLKNNFKIKELEDGKFSIIDAHGELMSEKYNTIKEARDVIDNNVKDILKDDAKKDLFNQLISNQKKATIFSSTSKNNKAVKLDNEAYSELKGNDKYFTADTIDKVLEKLTPKEQSVVKAIRDFTDNHLDMIKVLAEREGILFAERDNYYPALVSELLDKGDSNYVDEIEANISGNLSSKTKSTIERTGALKYRNFDAYSMINRYADKMYKDYYFTPSIKKQLGGLTEIGKEYVKKGNDTALPQALRESVKQAYKDELNSSSWLSNKKFLSDMMRWSRFKALVGIQRPIREIPSNVLKSIGWIEKISKPEGKKELNDNIDELLYFMSGGLPKVKSEDYINRLDMGDPNANKTAIDKFVNAKLLSAGDRIVGTNTWKNKFLLRFKEKTGVSLDIDKFINDENYRIENFDDVQKSIRYADSIYSETYQPQTKGSDASDFKVFGARMKQDDFFRGVMSALNKFNIGESIVANYAARDFIRNTNEGRARAAQKLAMMQVSNMFYFATGQLAMNTLAYLSADDKEKEKWKERLNEIYSPEGLTANAITNLFMLSFGKYGNLSRTALGLLYSAGANTFKNAIVRDNKILDKKTDEVLKKLDDIGQTTMMYSRMKLGKEYESAEKQTLNTLNMLVPLLGDAIFDLYKDSETAIKAVSIAVDNVNNGTANKDELELYSLAMALHNIMQLTIVKDPAYKEINKILNTKAKENADRIKKMKKGSSLTPQQEAQRLVDALKKEATGR